ncbi:kynureninase [Meira miltonrushii]|uniref:Kynureninase n=1 Tax=Meira miltonrushii TaxID=1280837 RepID=A0A316V4W1_9BASI|nr:kynureninase [Meira miltonrushii]PWN32609.1 kynureninase [Meira miltonrushii]
MKDVVEGNEKDEQATSLYMCGNSLGPLSKRSKKYVEQELQVWGRKAVLGHWDHPFGRPWTQCEERVSHLMSDIIGAKPNEVVAMGTLSSNLHIMLATFYRPNALPQLVLPNSAGNKPVRHKIIYEALAFPSDQYALASAVTLAGFDPKTSLIALEGKKDRTLETQDILATIDREADTGELAMILLGDVQYQTGQMFDMEKITKHARSRGIIVGWDLAHAFANVPLAMHDWDADFAVWCTYKYGSSGPGGMAGLFVHERWGNNSNAPGASGLPRPAAWWGQKKASRFSMPDSFDAIQGASGWQQSNPSALDMAALLGSLETMALAPALGSGHIMPALRQKSQRLTAYLEHLLLTPGFLPAEANISIVTPKEGRFRGSQLSSDVPPPIDASSFVARVHHSIETRYGVVCDVRNPDILRFGPVAQYSSFEDVWRTADALRKSIMAQL